MKILLVFFIFLFTTNSAFAQTIQTGDAKAEAKVETNVSGGDVYTKIEVEANGEKKVLETTEPGIHKLEVSSNSETITENKKTTPSATITPIKEKEAIQKKEQINLIMENFKNWVINLIDSLNFFSWY